MEGVDSRRPHYCVYSTSPVRLAIAGFTNHPLQQTRNKGLERQMQKKYEQWCVRICHINIHEDFRHALLYRSKGIAEV